MFLSQTETYASMNYRMMSQARYGGEAAVQKASDFLLDGTQYTGSVQQQCDRSAGQFRSHRVAGAVEQRAGRALRRRIQGVELPCGVRADRVRHRRQRRRCPPGRRRCQYGAYATLLTMQLFESYGGFPSVVQTWEITGVGGLAGGRPATVEVVAIVETPKVPANSYAAFATANTCGAIYFHGNVTVDSYDSSQGPYSGAGNSQEDSGGDVGTNGNLEIQGSVDVFGNLYTPRTGVGTCTEGAVNALTETGSADVNGSIVQLPTAVAYPTPTFSATPGTNTVTINSGASLAAACGNLGLTLNTNCFISGSTIRIDGGGVDVTLPNVVVGGGYKLVIDGNNPPQTININSLTGSGDVEINANLTSNTNEAVVIKIAGKNADNTDMETPFDLSQMSWKQNSANHAYDASALQIVYGGPCHHQHEGRQQPVGGRHLRAECRLSSSRARRTCSDRCSPGRSRITATPASTTIGASDGISTCPAIRWSAPSPGSATSGASRAIDRSAPSGRGTVNFRPRPCPHLFLLSR